VTGQNSEPEPITALVTDKPLTQGEENIEIPAEIKEAPVEINQSVTSNAGNDVSVNPSPSPEPLPIADCDPSPHPSPNPSPGLQQLNEDELELVEMIRTAVAEPDTEIARQAAADILPILKDVCARGATNREKVWAALTDSERATFSELTAKPIAAHDNPPEPQPPETTPE